MNNRDYSESVSEQLCLEAIEQTADAVYITDSNGTIEYVNPAFEEITGYERAEVVGKTPQILNSGVHDEDFFADLWETITAGERWEMEVVDETKCGDTIVFEQTISPITTSENEIENFVAVARDITDRKNRERDLEQFKQIQSRVLRHNLRNRLNVIQSHAEYCSEHLEADYADKAEKIVSASNDLEELTNKTRTIEFLMEHEQSPETVRLCERLQTLVEMHRDEYPAVSFAFDCPSGVTVEVEPEIQLVFENIIDNAAKHNTAESPAVAVTVRTDGAAAATVTVSDNGPGIPDQELLALEQSDESPLSHGTGIGLWIVGWIIERTEASLTCDTAKTGTEFVVEFPLVGDS